MKRQLNALTIVVVCAMLALPCMAQTTTAIPPALTTPEKVASRIGMLDFNDGAPGDALDTRPQTNDQDVKGEKR